MAEPVELEDWLELASGLLALAIAIAAVLAWRRRPTPRTALVAAAFTVFALRGVLMALSDFVVSGGTGDVLESLAVPLEIAFLGAIALVLLRA